MSFRGETAYALATKVSLDWIPNSVADELFDTDYKEVK